MRTTVGWARIWGGYLVTCAGLAAAAVGDACGGDDAADARDGSPDASTQSSSSGASGSSSGGSSSGAPSTGPAGTLDQTFGTGGVVKLPGMAALTRLAFDSAGRILVGGGFDNSTTVRAEVVRLLGDGQLDTGYGMEAGATRINQVSLADMELLSGDRLHVQGTGRMSVANNIGMARLTAEGHLDPSFADGGVVAPPPPGSGTYSLGDGVALADGSIITVVNGYSNSWLGRYEASGGSATFDAALGPSDRPTHVLRASSDTLLVAGRIYSDVFLAKIKIADGAYDTTFGGGTGRVGFDGAAFTDVVLQPDGSIVGAVQKFLGGSVAIVRFSATGVRDEAFAPSLPGLQLMGNVRIAGSNGDILVSSRSGDASVNETPSVTVARVRADGTMDPAFGANGYSLVPVASGGPMAVQPDGKMLVGGAFYVGDAGWNVAVARLFP